MPGLGPGIHVFGPKQGVDRRDFKREDGASRLLPGDDSENCRHHHSPSLRRAWASRNAR